jgi:hypothetical protein
VTVVVTGFARGSGRAEGVLDGVDRVDDGTDEAVGGTDVLIEGPGLDVFVGCPACCVVPPFFAEDGNKAMASAAITATMERIPATRRTRSNLYATAPPAAAASSSTAVVGRRQSSGATCDAANTTPSDATTYVTQAAPKYG